MKKWLLIVVIASFLFSREYVAVIDFEGIGVSKDEARALTQKLTSELISIGEFQLIQLVLF